MSGRAFRELRRSSLAALLVASALVGCAGSRGAGPSSAEDGSQDSVRRFDWVATNGAPVSNETTAGRLTIALFLTTYDMASQVMVEQVGQLLRRTEPRINAFGVALEPPRNALLVDSFARTLGVPFPIIMADPATLDGEGAFGVIEGVPTVVLIDAESHEVFRHAGSLELSELASAVRQHNRK